ncbi:tail fiber domain-containing protein, partial [Enterococcus faecalis]|uniref:tail fiber domain-containing protein n=1 Tax=Enterococcus faecalis TaxID=1351 RepID=UPI003D0AC984
IAIEGVTISSSTFETSGINGKVHIAGGIVQFIDRNGKEFGYIYPANVSTPKNILEFSCNDAINISAGSYYGEPGKIAQSSIVLNSGYRDDEATIDLIAKKSGINLIAAYDTKGHSIIMDKEGVYMDGGLTLDKFLTVNNNTAINFYNHLNMHGYKIMNVSDIRLKENIETTRIDGIKETKKLNFVEFNRKQNYQSKDKRKQPPKSRELGLIA